jgi:hypothetical protein
MTLKSFVTFLISIGGNNYLLERKQSISMHIPTEKYMSINTFSIFLFISYLFFIMITIKNIFTDMSKKYCNVMY